MTEEQKAGKYKAFKGLSAGINSTYSIKDRLGNKSTLGFDSMWEAEMHIKSRIEKGQDPMTDIIDLEKMTHYLLNN